MKRLITCSMNEDILSYGEKEELGEQIFAIVQRYFKNWGNGRPYGCVKYDKYDKLEYTFKICSGYLNSVAQYVAGTDTYDAPDLNAFRKEVRQLLKSYGFSRCKFELKSFKVNEGNNTGYYTSYDRIYTYKELVAIYFAE